MFNEIVELADVELAAVMAQKAMLLSLSSARPATGERGLERAESHQALAGIGLAPSSIYSIAESKRFGSLDSLATAASVVDSTFAPSKTSCESLSKIALPANRQYAVWISFYELYGDKVYDMLALKSAKSSKNTPLGMVGSQLKVREDVNKVNGCFYCTRSCYSVCWGLFFRTWSGSVILISKSINNF